MLPNWPSSPQRPARLRLPLLPLPHHVIFPHTVFPFEVFEPRYRVLIQSLVKNDNRMCLARLKPANDDDDPTLPPPIEEIAPVGRLIHATAHADGHHSVHFLAEGRIRVREECAPAQPYREIEAEPLRDRCTESGNEERELLRALLLKQPNAPAPIIEAANELLTRDEPLGVVSDVACHLLATSAELRVHLFRELDPLVRLRALLSELSTDMSCGESASHIDC